MSKSFIILCTPTLWAREVERALVSWKTLNVLPGQGWRTSQGAEIDECGSTCGMMISTKNPKEVGDKYPSVPFSSTRNIAGSHLSLKTRIRNEKSVYDDMRDVMTDSEQSC
jgi:hypothetical protein